ncbi:hepcidin-like isoform X1 [Trachinotus anak]|uniref:hepcidin-like isoform X1 n=1 Tax=Trachinotus anak TaxID=443729 RepID=UPI0039F26608
MKTFSVAVAVAVMLTFICIQESSATFTEVEELEEAVSYDNPAVEHQETPVDSWMMPYNRQKRDTNCRFCCGCCIPRVCGLCCRF